MNCGFVSLAIALGTCIVAVAPAGAQQPSAFIYDTFVTECRKVGGTPRTSREQVNAGAKFECDRGGSGASTASPKGVCNNAAAKTNIDWVFADAGARRTFDSGRAQGLSAYDAVLRAQAHNAGAQNTIEGCAAWAANYLKSLAAAGAAPGAGGGGGAGPNGVPPLANKKLTAADCACVTILPAPNQGISGSFPSYTVRNTCPDTLNFTVWIKGTPPTVGPSTQDPYGLRDSLDSVTLAANQQSTLQFTRRWAIYSITATVIASAAGTFTCGYDR